MKKIIYTMMLSSAIVMSANAHEVWLELNSNKKEAKLFYGDFEEIERESGEKFAKIKEGVAYPKDAIKSVKRNDGDITYTLSKATDVVVIREDAPRNNRAEGVVTKRIYYSKAGITSKNPITAFEIVPINASKNTFKVVFNNKGVDKTDVSVISPTGWIRTFSTDEKGEFTILTPWKGEYLLQVSFTDNTKGEENGVAFDRTIHSSSLFLPVEKGLPWTKK